jgi:hypothetical protein
MQLCACIVRVTPSSPTPNQPPANPNAPLPGYGHLAPAYVVPTWYAPLAQAQYANTRAGSRQQLFRLEEEVCYALDAPTQGLAINGLSPLAAHRRLMTFVLNARVVRCEKGSDPEHNVALATMHAERETAALELVAVGMELRGG